MLPKDTIAAVVNYQADLYSKQDLGIRRIELDTIKVLDSFILVISGVRRSGKSTFLKQLLKERYDNSLLLNLEDPRLSGFGLSDFLRLDEIIKDQNYQAVAFDELQVIENWESYIRSKHEEQSHIIITGSNASLLSREFGTKLTGRYLSKEIFPFSFKEFLIMLGKEASGETVGEYMNLGGFPEFLKLREEDVLTRLMDDIIYRDIAVRYGIKQHKVLRQLATYLVSNSGKLYSLNNLKNVFGVGSVRSIADYVSYLEDSYLIFSIPKFSYSYKQQIANPRKVYCIDTGLASVNSFSMSSDYGRKLENLVFLHLRRGRKSLYYYSGNGECDFIIVKGNKPIKAVQVCFKLNSENLDRELNGIFSAMHELQLKEGIIITFDQEDVFEINNRKIKAVPAWKFLTGQD